MPTKERVEENKKLFGDLDSILGEVFNPTPGTKKVDGRAVSQNSFNAKEIQLPESFVGQITGQRVDEHIEETVEEIEEPQEESVREATETRLKNLVLQLKSLLEEAHSVISEVTTTGMIGTNQKFVLGKKNGSPKANKRNKSKFR